MQAKGTKKEEVSRLFAWLVLAAAAFAVVAVILYAHAHGGANTLGAASGAYFNGDTYVLLNNTVNGNFTAVAWVKYENANSLGVILSSGIGENEHSAWYMGDGGEILNKTACGVFSNQKVGNYTAGWRFAMANELEPGAWHQIICEYNTSYISLYIDGNFISATYTPYQPLHASIMEIGKRTSTFYLNGTVQTYAYFNGTIADVQVYNSALGASNIRRLYSEGISALQPSNASIYVPFNGQSLHAGGSVGYYYEGHALEAAVK